MSTRILIRSLMMTYILSSPRLVRISIPAMNKISHSKSWFLNPDRNPILHFFVRKLVYDPFSAGQNEAEIQRTMSTIKDMGFEGVILGYSKETLVDKSATAEEAAGLGRGVSCALESCVEEWKEGNLRTLAMLGTTDFLAIKLTGAGPLATESLAKKLPPPPVVLKAITEICDQASKQKTRLWIDAEQQVFQTAILKGTPANIEKHLSFAQDEGWTLGIKLVRGAYIASEPRHLIHDTIEDTHAAYNSIVQSLLTRNFPGVDPSKEFPSLQLMLASHNEESVKKGYGTWRERKENGLPTIYMEIAQLQGMADEISCGLVQARREMCSEKVEWESECYPRAFKCLCWGGAQESIQFLVRSVIENRGSLDRTRFWLVGLKRELWRRIKSPLGFR
ncbi:FAD-linked oxidoreductase-like protein [Rhexocercosporidium sp. MPI-PUGE-AT-0058]|nr:FAD-linked oxidoreductase-like protein [Rhexocercosporidium sp. MPI-PUGE-AT-0058]